MSTVPHLYPVPDPEPDEELTPAATTAAGVPRVAPVPDVDEPEELDDAELGEEDEEELDDEELGEEDTAPRRALTLPDLRPYADLRAAAKLAPVAYRASRRPRAAILRGLRRVLADLRDSFRRMLRAARIGTGVLGRSLVGWLTGTIKPGGSFIARAGGVAFGVFAAWRFLARHGYLAAGTLLLAWWIAALTAERWAALAAERKAAAEAKAAEKKNKGKGKKKDATEDAEKEPKKSPAKASADPVEEDEEDLEEDLEEELEETPVEAPLEVPAEAPEEEPVEPSGPPSPDDISEAIHRLFQGGSGVLLTALAETLSLPSTRVLKELLDEAGISHKPGVRTPAGNGPGIHHTAFPPRPPRQRGPQGTGVGAGQEPTTTNNNAEDPPREGNRVVRTDYGSVIIYPPESRCEKA